MEPSSKILPEVTPQGHVQGSHVSGVRGDSPDHGASVAGLSGAGDQLAPYDYATAHADALKRQKDAEVEAGYHACFRATGFKAASDKSAQAFARYDAKDRGVQLAEFYRYNDSEVASRGYI